MKNCINQFLFSLLALPCLVWASETTAMSPTGGVMKMALGLAIVLAVMALITWLLKRLMPNVANKQSILRVVGGVSVGSRERVVVLEVAGRWLVIGVAPGQISQLANLEVAAMQGSETSNIAHIQSLADEGSLSNTFAQWLSKSTAKIFEKKDVKN